MSTERERKVRRVLVMLDYGDHDPHSGEVFDVTALAHEIASNQNSKHNHCKIQLDVSVTKNYSSTSNECPMHSLASWNVMADFHSSGDAAHLEDAINVSLPDVAAFATNALPFTV